MRTAAHDAFARSYGPPILFGSESFIDELAAATNTDPVAFRLRYLSNPRDRDAVKTAAEKYGWDARPSPRNGQRGANVAVGRGIAYRRHFDTFIALVAEVRVHCDTGVIDVLRSSAPMTSASPSIGDAPHVIDRQLVYGTSRIVRGSALMRTWSRASIGSPILRCICRTYRNPRDPSD